MEIVLAFNASGFASLCEKIVTAIVLLSLHYSYQAREEEDPCWRSELPSGSDSYLGAHRNRPVGRYVQNAICSAPHVSRRNSGAPYPARFLGFVAKPVYHGGDGTRDSG